MLVDLREGDNPGVILQHPLFDKMMDKYGKLPDRFKDYRVSADDLPNNPERERNYVDPLSKDPEGAVYKRHYLARMEPVKVRDEKIGWVVIVQKAYDEAIGTTLSDLRKRLIHYRHRRPGDDHPRHGRPLGLDLENERETANVDGILPI